MEYPEDFHAHTILLADQKLAAVTEDSAGHRARCIECYREALSTPFHVFIVFVKP